MLQILLITALLQWSVSEAATTAKTSTATTCTNSYECGQHQCCRDANGDVMSDQELGGFELPVQAGGSSGTCSTQLAQKDEMCDSDCDCDAGLACYRPMSGVCCPPMKCYDAEYVKQQQEYWNNCGQDPTCMVPP